VASLSQGRTAAAQCGLFTHKSVPVIFEPPCTFENVTRSLSMEVQSGTITFLKLSLTVKNTFCANLQSDKQIYI